MEQFLSVQLKIGCLIFAHTVQLFNQIFYMCTHMATERWATRSREGGVWDQFR